MAKTAAVTGEGANRSAPAMAAPKTTPVMMRAASMTERLERSELHDLGFLVLQERIDHRDVAVRELLDFLVAASLVVLGNHLLLQQVLDVAERLAPNVAQCDAPRLGVRSHDLDEIAAPLLGHRRQRHADHLARRHGIQAEARVDDGLLDGRHHVLFPRRHDERSRVVDGDVGRLFHGHVRAVVLDHDVLEQARVRAARAQLAHVVLECFDAALHALLGFFLDVVDHLPVPVRGKWFMTEVPTASPVTTRTRSPGVFKLNTTSGRLFSRHMTMAVASMTRRSSDKTWSNDRAG